MPCRLPRKIFSWLFVSLLTTHLFSLTSSFPVVAGEQPELPRVPPTSPEETTNSFQGVDGFTLQLLAAELKLQESALPEPIRQQIMSSNATEQLSNN